MTDIMKLAGEYPFDKVAIVETKDLIFVPEYRKFCEENLCHQYGINPACPPACGNVESMKEKCLQYEKAVILKIVRPLDDEGTSAAAEKHSLNAISVELMDQMLEDGIKEAELMSAGPFRGYSCASAYCLDMQKAAELAGMECWKNDGNMRLFTMVMYNE